MLKVVSFRMDLYVNLIIIKLHKMRWICVIFLKEKIPY